MPISVAKSHGPTVERREKSGHAEKPPTYRIQFHESMHGLDAIIGQTELKALIRPKIKLAKESGMVLPHLLLCGEREHGKMTFAARMAEDLEVLFSSVSAETISIPLHLTGILSNVRARQILAINDIDALRPELLDLLVEAISTFQCLIIIVEKRHILPMPKFTLVATTSKPWLVDERVTRWCIPCKFASYGPEEVAQIVLRIAQNKGIALDYDAAFEVATLCRNKPGEANIFLQRVANSFPFEPLDRINRSRLRQIVEFLGAGNLYPEVLALAEDLQRMSGHEFERWVANLFRPSWL